MQISEYGALVMKINQNKWFRCFGNRAFKNATYKWTLKIEEYPKNKQTDITFGICEDSLVGDQKDYYVYTYDQHINIDKYYGIDGNHKVLHMEDTLDNDKDEILHKGDKYDFYLNCSRGEFKITKEGVEIAHKTGLPKNVSYRPSVDMKSADGS